jgi:hypothetical protein
VTHLPPEVCFSVAKSRGHFYGMWFLSVLAAVVALRFSFDSLVWGFSLGACTLICALIGFRAWRASPLGNLSWRDQHWHWSGWGDVPITSLSVLLDFQGLMLVVVRSAASQRMWLWLEPAPGDANWIKLRRGLTLTLPLEPRQTTTI